MDDIVLAAMAKWPQVPACHGWLGLDARGDWYMRDAPTQALGGFQSGRPGSKGSLLRHDLLIAFIARNYACGPDGCWYFQNGPQRVFVELEITPWIWRLQPGPGFDVGFQHLSRLAVDRCLVDERGRVYLSTPQGLGLVHSQDVGLAAQALEQGLWPLEEVVSNELPARFHYVLSPQEAAAQA